MKIYFLSSKPCALMLGGVYFGMTDLFERFAEVSPKDNIFAEFIPQGGLPIGFFINEKLRFEPPFGCEVYILRDGVAVYARDFIPTDFSLKIIAQERFVENLITVFRQGALQISLETAKGFFVAKLPEEFGSCKILRYGELFFLESSTPLQAEGAPFSLAAFNTSGKRIFYERIIKYSVTENTLNATLSLSDSKHRVAECTWALTEDGCFQTSFKIKQYAKQCAAPEAGADAGAGNAAGNSVSAERELLPYAFFESILIGADFKEMLSEELKGKADHIKNFLGEFCAVTLTKDPYTCGLVRKKQERLYEVYYYSVEIENGKICEVKG